MSSAFSLGCAAGGRGPSSGTRGRGRSRVVDALFQDGWWSQLDLNQ